MQVHQGGEEQSAFIGGQPTADRPAGESYRRKATHAVKGMLESDKFGIMVKKSAVKNLDGVGADEGMHGISERPLAPIAASCAGDAPGLWHVVSPAWPATALRPSARACSACGSSWACGGAGMPNGQPKSGAGTAGEFVQRSRAELVERALIAGSSYL